MSEEIANQQKLRDLLDHINQSEEQRLEHARDQAKITIEQVKAQRELQDLAGNELESTKLRNEERRADVKLRRAEYGMAMAQLEDELKKLKEKEEITGSINTLRRQELADETKILQAFKEQIDLEEKAADVLDKIGDKVSDIITNLTGIGDQWKETIAGSFIVAMETAGGFREALTRTSEALGKTLSFANLLGSSYQKMGEATLALAYEQDNAIASFRKATSTYGEFDDQLIELERNNIGFGISTADAANAVGTLYTEVTNFALMSKDARKQLASTAARMEKLGVATSTTAAVMEIATRVLKMTKDETIELSMELAAAAEAMSMPISTLTENFVKSMPVLAKWGDAAPRIFKKVQASARSLGIETGRLLDIVGQFDTFEGAAEAAGKLNAILGGNLLNSTELLLADEAERVKMIQRTIEASGRSWKSMNRFEKQAVASTLGITDMNEATKLMTEGLDDFTKGVDVNGLSQEDLKKRMEDTRSITEKLSEIWRAFAVSFRWPIEQVHKLADAFFRLTQEHENLVPIILGLAGAVKVATVSMGLMGVSFGSIIKSTGPAQALQKKFAKGITSTGTAAKGAATSLLATGAAILMIGAGIGIAAWGIASMATAMKGMGAESIALVAIVGILVGGFYLMIPALAGIAAAGAAAALPLLAVGLAMFLVGAAIALAAGGVAELVKTIGSMGSEAMGVAKAMGLLSLAIIPFALFGVFAAAGIGALAISLLAVAAALAFIKTDDLEALSSMMVAMGNMPVEIGPTMLGAGKGLVSVAKASKEVNEDGAKGITEIFKSLTAYHAEIKVAPSAATATAAAAGKTTSSTPGTPARPIEIILQVDQAELGRVVATAFDKSTTYNVAMDSAG